MVRKYLQNRAIPPTLRHYDIQLDDSELILVKLPEVIYIFWA